MTQRTAIVTGAARRVGRALAEALLAEGWTVIAHAHEDVADLPNGVIGVAAELADADCAERIFAAAQGQPPIRLLINNAARFAPDALGAFDGHELERHMAVNLAAPVRLTQQLAQHHAGGDACIVNLLDSKLDAPNADFLSYTLSKQALAGFTAIAARALAGQGIRVNAVAPALMLRSPGQDEANFAAMHAANPLRRGVQPADVAAAVRYLAGAATVTGSTITIDGGQRFWSLPRDVQFLEQS